MVPTRTKLCPLINQIIRTAHPVCTYVPTYVCYNMNSFQKKIKNNNVKNYKKKKEPKE